VRLEKPFSLVSYLIQDDKRLNEADVQARVDTGKTNYLSIKNPINVYIAYLTAWVDENNLVNFRDDIYHLDN
jgi:murein L,D-transpeptidase YcbB/YkuD